MIPMPFHHMSQVMRGAWAKSRARENSRQSNKGTKLFQTQIHHTYHNSDEDAEVTGKSRHHSAQTTRRGYWVPFGWIPHKSTTYHDADDEEEVTGMSRHDSAHQDEATGSCSSEFRISGAGAGVFHEVDAFDEGYGFHEDDDDADEDGHDEDGVEGLIAYIRRVIERFEFRWRAFIPRIHTHTHTCMARSK